MQASSSGDPHGEWLSDDYPWQRLTRLHSLSLTRRLEMPVDVEQLVRECASIEAKFPLRPHPLSRRPGYEMLALVAAGGSLDRDAPLLGEPRATPALGAAPYLQSLLASFGARPRRARLMRLAPNRAVPWHYDAAAALGPGCVRLHLPVATNPEVRSQLCHQDYMFRPGEVWHGDFGFPHRLWNRGATHRAHLVVDVERSGRLAQLLDRLPGEGSLRADAEARCQELFDAWFRERRRELERRTDDHHGDPKNASSL